jgi:hypothetical protein
LNTLFPFDRFWWISFLCLIFLTFLSWQFRFQETGTIYHDNPSLRSWCEGETFGKEAKPQTLEGGILQIRPNAHSRTGTRRSWRAQDRYIKVRIRHRATEELHQISPEKKYPLLIQLASYRDLSLPFLKSPDILAFRSPPSYWTTCESITPLPQDSKVFTLYLSTLANGGAYEISEILVTGVKQRSWFSLAVALLLIGWGGWIYRTLRQFHPTSYLPTIRPITATLWILLWATLIAFPRPIDIPRPFLKTFQTGVANERITAQRVMQPQDTTPKEKKKQPALQTSQTFNWQHSLSKIKNHSIGRFFLHFGVMMTLAGFLLLLYPITTAAPFILIIMLGGELIPYLWLGEFDLSDQIDLIAYASSLAITIPMIKHLKKRFLTRLRRRSVSSLPPQEHSQDPSQIQT